MFWVVLRKSAASVYHTHSPRAAQLDTVALVTRIVSRDVASAGLSLALLLCLDAPSCLGNIALDRGLAPTYYYDDLVYLVKQGCVTQGRFTPLYNARGARRFVARQLEIGRDCFGALRDYPSLRIDPLEWHYACLLSLRVLDEALITDLIRGPWWVETV